MTMSKLCPTTFSEYRRAWNRYQRFGKNGIPHIMSPTDPRKQLYNRALRDLRQLLTKEPALMEALEEVELFERVFEEHLKK